jgi:hypothetical protein
MLMLEPSENTTPAMEKLGDETGQRGQSAGEWSSDTESFQIAGLLSTFFAFVRKGIQELGKAYSLHSDRDFQG